MKIPSLAMLNIGSELLRGRTINTNLSDAAKMLTPCGFHFVEAVIIHDGEKEIADALHALLQTHDVVIVTGGLGPTRDDMTKKVLAHFFGDGEMIIHQPTLNQIEEWVKSRNRTLSDKMKEQAMVPACCEVLLNPVGSAPGMLFRRGEQFIFSIPGVPVEMNRLMKDNILPLLLNAFGAAPMLLRVLRTFNYPESDIATQVDALGEKISPEVQIAYLPHDGEVKIEMRAPESKANELNSSFDALHHVLSKWIFSTDESGLPETAGKMLRESGFTVACAESCTGGALARLITSVSGSSDYFIGSAVVYSAEAKIKVLGVNPETIARHSIVSEEVAAEMAQRVRELYQTDIGIGITGTAEVLAGDPVYGKPHICFALADSNGIVTRTFVFISDRNTNINRAARTALVMIINRLRKSE